MSFIVTATAVAGSVSFHRSTAQSALDKMRQLQMAGFRIEVKDGYGRTLAEDELVSLATEAG